MVRPEAEVCSGVAADRRASCEQLYQQCTQNLQFSYGNNPPITVQNSEACETLVPAAVNILGPLPVIARPPISAPLPAPSLPPAPVLPPNLPPQVGVHSTAVFRNPFVDPPPVTVPPAHSMPPVPSDQRPPPVVGRGNKYEILTDDRAIYTAGGLEAFIVQNMRRDGRFRIYSYVTTWCPPCSALKRAIAAAQKTRNDIDFTGIDAEKITRIDGPSGGVPESIIQYSDCRSVVRESGFGSWREFEASMNWLKKRCGG